MKRKTKFALPDMWVKVLLWVLIAVYTYLLPQARLIYNWIVSISSNETAGKVPLALVAAAGCVFVFAVLRGQKDRKRLLYLIPCALISYLIMILVENPNKHIHIPQYVIMVWLLYTVISKDHPSGDALLIIFIYGSMLGVVDELEQGLHPSRFYGWIDMAVNSSSALIGIFTVMGLRTIKPMDWSWTPYLKEAKGLLWTAAFGVAGVVPMCVHLFRVQTSAAFRGVYPTWLLAWSYAFLAFSLAALAAYLYKIREKYQISEQSERKSLPAELKIVNLWTIPMLTILFYMHAILVYISITGIEFA